MVGSTLKSEEISFSGMLIFKDQLFFNQVIFLRQKCCFDNLLFCCISFHVNRLFELNILVYYERLGVQHSDCLQGVDILENSVMQQTKPETFL